MLEPMTQAAQGLAEIKDEVQKRDEGMRTSSLREESGSKTSKVRNDQGREATGQQEESNMKSPRERSAKKWRPSLRAS